MAWVVLLLLGFASAGRFADFIIGKRGQRRIKSLLADLYVILAEGNWSDLVRLASSSIDAFLSRWLGVHLWSLRAASRLFMLSIVADILLLTGGFAVSSGGLSNFYWFQLPGMPLAVFVFVLSSALVTAVFFGIARALYRHSSDLHSWLFAVIVIECDVVLGYLAVMATLLVAVPMTFSFIFNYKVTNWEIWATLAPAYARSIAFWPGRFQVVIGSFSLSVLAAAAALPMALHLGAFLMLVMFRVSRPLTQRPITVLLERLDDAPNGILTVMGVACGLVAGLCGALAHALGF